MSILAAMAAIVVPLLCVLVGLNAVVYLLGPPERTTLPEDWKAEDERRVP